jgi:hypothetical protein
MTIASGVREQTIHAFKCVCPHMSDGACDTEISAPQPAAQDSRRVMSVPIFILGAKRVVRIRRQNRDSGW